MKRSFRKYMAIFCSILLCLSLNIVTFAAEPLSPYEIILNQINAEYGLNIGYGTVNESKVTLEEYENVARQIAIQQRNLYNYIASKKVEQSPMANYVAKAAVDKTVTKPCWGLYSSHYSITLTYTVYDGVRINNCRNGQITQTFEQALKTDALGIYIANPSSPSYSIIDGGETAAVSIDVEYHTEDHFYFDNITLYAEFYCID